MAKKAKGGNNPLKSFDKWANIVPDTTKIIGDTVQAAAPILDKALDRNYEKEKNRISIPNVLDLDLLEGKELLEKLGFLVTVTLVKPDKKYSTARDNEIVDMIPKSGRVDKGSVIKLYYVTQEIIDSSNLDVPIPNLLGLSITEAREHLKDLGLKPAYELLKAEARWANQQVNTVLDMEPKVSLFSSTVVKGSILKLKYIDEATLEESRKLAQAAAKKQLDLGQLVGRIPNFLPQNKQE